MHPPLIMANADAVKWLVVVASGGAGYLARTRMSGRTRARQSGGKPPMTDAERNIFMASPILGPLWVRLSPRGRRILLAAAVACGLALLWVLLMAQTQLTTCDTASGGIPSGDQRGFTLAFCGTPTAAPLDTALVFGLVGAIPIGGLLLALIAMFRRRGAARWAVVGAGAVAVSAPVGVAWLLAGAH